jgi:hypothetical protein
MSEVVVKTDRLSVFHGVNGKRAGTLEVHETVEPNKAPAYTWTWRGGPIGPKNGVCHWDKENPALLLEETLSRDILFLGNDAWIGRPRPPQFRPWFRPQDKLDLVDYAFMTRPNRPHVFRLKIITASPS